MKNWEVLVDRYTKNCRTRGLSEATIRHRESELFRFKLWARKKHRNLKVEDIELDHIHQYIKHRTPFLSKSSTFSVYSILRCMGDFLVEESVWIQNPMRWISGPKMDNTRKIPRNYHRSDLKKIFDESFNGQIRYFRLLYPAVISLFYSTGIRKSELLSLNIEHWDSESSTLKVFGKKVGRDRIVPVPEVGWKCLENYLIERNNLLLKLGKEENALFVNKLGKRVNGTQILVQFKRIAKRAGVDKATIHMFRHSCATGLIEEGVPLPQVQQILGHSSISTTNRYLSISSPERKKAMRLHPINNILNQLKEEESE